MHVKRVAKYGTCVLLLMRYKKKKTDFSRQLLVLRREGMCTSDYHLQLISLFFFSPLFHLYVSLASHYCVTKRSGKNSCLLAAPQITTIIEAIERQGTPLVAFYA